jgi:uncharacterized protein YndB with AHSA1/START domain
MRMTESSHQAVHISRTFSASPALLFEAWLDPDLVARWMFVSEFNHIRATTDRRAGGNFSIREWNDGDEIEHFGEYLEIQPERRVAFTLEVPKQFDGVTQVTVEIAPYASGSAMLFTQTGVNKNVTEEHWRKMFETLENVLEQLQ